jgi:hypothetical protein
MKTKNQNIPTMEPTKILIENWPKDPWMKTWMPLIISSIFTLIALFLSLKSFNFTKIESVKNSRPYVWAINYGYTDSSNKFHPEPQSILFRVSNSPAKILKKEIHIKLKEASTYKELVSPQIEYNFVRFPDNNALWSFSLGIDDWGRIENLSTDVKRNLERHIFIQYSFLDGRDKFEFKLIQKFIPEDNQWRDIDIQAN